MEQKVQSQPDAQSMIPNQVQKHVDNLMHSFNSTDPTAMPTTKVIFSLLLVVLLGLGSGFGIAKVKGATHSTGKGGSGSHAVNSSAEKGKTYGSTDTTVNKDSAEGKMVEGGVEGEGQYHLERPGGDSQNVYLTSSTVDLAQFMGRKVKVWGQTQTAQKVGWLMDVGGVKVLD